ncbi:nucleotide sugar dehydrogenase [Sphingomonas sp. SUN019]|uniref:nucleotide sugar dehydrogenase n=1 Tax=Sphingomonas sp. SUN019 TaxID=2937788 RepID=UPI002164D5BE|nr:nucleotide sugar dehydrogenase [Sphingomonas sp. SUN019]UVO50891.1 nucleotide sugar dehydrogenase [Sphingomonas sp. SUN019]
MRTEEPRRPHIAVVGLGYVGLPLAVALAKQFTVTGYDVDAGRIAELRAHHDRTNEIDPALLAASALRLTGDPADARGADIFIVTVPTPVDADNRPDLGAVMSATRTVAALIEAGREQIVVYESTVYPGVTEDECGPLIEAVSGLTRGRDFFLGYSPERINPGDREHAIERITKVVAGENAAVTSQLTAIYGAITSGGVFVAASIKAAEAAKVIENAQRDINIAFINEVTQIFSRVGLSIWDVLDAARTKWNFLDFRPGLVGGHCIGVDPFYLSHLAQRLGHEPRVILSGRTLNDTMGGWVANRIHALRDGRAGRVLILGLTFKENVPDIRNSRVIDVIARLRALGHDVSVHDPLADPEAALEHYGLELVPDPSASDYDVIVLAVAHAAFVAMDDDSVMRMVSPGGLVFDLKGCWRGRSFGALPVHSL